MNYLSNDEINLLDQKIDSSIKVQRALLLPRDIAIVNLLRHLEHRIISWKMRSEKLDNFFSDDHAVVTNGICGVDFAMDWIYTFCTKKEGKNNFVISDSLKEAIKELQQSGLDYKVVWQIMSKLYRKRLIGYINNAGVIQIEDTNKNESKFRIADYFVGSPQIEHVTNEGIKEIWENFNSSELILNTNIYKLPNGTITYKVEDSLFKKLFTILYADFSKLRWNFDPKWEVGGYTIQDFRIFSVTLMTTALIHNFICTFAEYGRVPYNSLVIVHNKKRWLNEIVRRTNLKKEIVEKIFDDLTYDHNLYAKGGKRPDITYQPFFPLENNLFALSNTIARYTNAERNLWDLISIKRQGLHSILRNKKESVWIDELKLRLEKNRLCIFKNFKVETDAYKTDLDVLIIDLEKNFALVVQLKWLTGPKDPSSIRNQEEDLKTGQIQASQSLKWVKENSLKISQKTQIPLEKINKIKFEALVLSKNFIGLNVHDETSPPIISEQLMFWILEEPHKKELLTVWEVAKNHAYLPKKNKHFYEEDMLIQFGGVNFLEKNRAQQIGNSWTPLDINLATSK